MIYNITQVEMRKLTLDWISKEDDSIIELGCSNGNFANLLFENKITNYCGIDIQKDKINEAKKKLPKMGFFCCDILNNLHIL